MKITIQRPFWHNWGYSEKTINVKAQSLEEAWETVKDKFNKDKLKPADILDYLVSEFGKHDPYKRHNYPNCNNEVIIEFEGGKTYDQYSKLNC